MAPWAPRLMLGAGEGRLPRNRLASVALRTSSGSPQVLAVQLQQVKGAEEDVPALTLAPQPLEHGDAVVVAGDRLPVDQARARLEPVHGLEDQRIPRRPVVAVPGQQADADRIAARHQPIAVVLNLMHPAQALSGVARQARAGKAR